MPKIEFKWALLIAAIFLGGASFYWFEYRPSVARQKCAEAAQKYAVLTFEQDIKNGGWRGLAAEDFSMSKKKLLAKYKGYALPEIIDREFGVCLRYRGINN